MSQPSPLSGYQQPNRLLIVAEGDVADQMEIIASQCGLNTKVLRELRDAQDDLASSSGAKLLLQYRANKMSLEEQRGVAQMLDDPSREGCIGVIIDQSALDWIGPVFDLRNIDFCVWEGRQSDPMTALDMIGVEGSMREDRPMEGTSIETLATIRAEIGRLAESVARLLPEETPEGHRSAHGERTSAESAELLRMLVRQRRARADFFPEDMFADPAWDILLDLAAARHEKKRVSVSSLCIAAAVPTTTGLRWIKALTDAGLLMRESDPEDGRRSFVKLTPQSANLMERYLDSIF